MNEIKIMGLDLGGTNIKAVLVNGRGHIYSKHTLDTGAEQGPDHVIERLQLTAQQVCEQNGCSLSDVAGVGVGSPGPLNIREGKVIEAANLPGWENVPLRDRLEKMIGRPTVLVNDANAAAYGEYWIGAGRGARHLCLLTLGTGVGGGVICNGEIVEGHFDNAGELGHMIVHPGGRQCRCGQKGCLEAYAGSSYLTAEAVRLMREGNGDQLQHVFTSRKKIEVPDIIAASLQGDDLARELWEEACEAIAIACVNLQHALNPQRILLGGGMAAAGQALLDPVVHRFKGLTWKLADDVPEIRLTVLGNEAGAIGAAGWFWHTHHHLGK